MKRQVKDLLTKHRSLAYSTIKPNESIYDALRKLAESNVESVLLLKNSNIVGIFSERDFAKATLRGGANLNLSLNSSVDLVATKTVYCVDTTYTLENCLRIMSQFDVKHLPVFHNGEVVSVLGMKDIMSFVVEDKDHEIQNLESYITGSAAPKLSNPSTSTTPPIKICTLNV